MFLGTIPKLLLEYLIGEIKRIKPKRIFLLFSGNFGVEKAISNICPDIEIISTDISLYSRAIGFGLINKKFQVEYRPELLEQFPFFKDKTTPIDYAVAVIFFLEVANNLEKNHHRYYRSLNNEAVNNTEMYYNQIKSKLLSFASTLGKLDFRGIDAIKLIEECGKGDFVFFDPPYWADGYDKMFEQLEKYFDFDTPEFTVIDEEKTLNSLALLHEKECIVYYRSIDELQLPNYKIVFKHNNKINSSLLTYSNYKESTISVSRKFQFPTEQPKYELFKFEDVITINSKIVLKEIERKHANHYRLLWVKKADATKGGIPYLIFIDGKVIGLIQVETSLGFKYHDDIARIFADPCVPTSRYKRLSKLILALCLTETFLKQYNEDTLWYNTGFKTAVFTNAHTSMKYRNLFKLTNRMPLNNGKYKYKLLYQNKKLFKDYKSALAYWLKKDGKILNA